MPKWDVTIKLRYIETVEELIKKVQYDLDSLTDNAGTYFILKIERVDLED